MDKPNIINRFVFINNISSFSMIDQVYNRYDKDVSPQPNFIGLLLTYEKCHRLAQLCFADRNIVLQRMQKPIYFTDLPNSEVLSFSNLKATNDKSKEEICVMFQFMNQLKFYMLKASKIRKHHEASYKSRNIIRFADRLFFWEDKGRLIDRLEAAIKKDEKTYFYKAYEAKNIIKMCKKIHFKSGAEWLMIWDEDKYIKLLSYDAINKRLRVEKEMFVHREFATNDDLDALENFNYVNGILYNNFQSYLLQERGTERGDLSVDITSEHFNETTSRFPLCSVDYIISQLQYVDENSKSWELFMTPPLNSSRIKTSAEEFEIKPIEYFLQSDDSFVIKIVIVSPVKYIIKLWSQTGFEYDRKIIEEENAFAGICDISRNGRYFTYVYIKESKYYATVWEIDKTGDSSSQDLAHPDTKDEGSNNNENNSKMEKLATKKQNSGLTPKLLVRVSDPLDFEYGVKLEAKDNFQLDSKHHIRWKITNEGNVIGFSLRQQKFFLNDIELFDIIRPKIKRFFKEITPEKDWAFPIDVTNIYIGESYILVRLPKAIISFNYNVRDKEIGNFKRIKHVPITEYNNINLERIVITSHPDYFLLIYKFITAYNFIVWGITENVEISSFSSREEDLYQGFIHGNMDYDTIDYRAAVSVSMRDTAKDLKRKKEAEHNQYKLSSIGYLMFDKYYVNLDSWVPIPFLKLENDIIPPSYYDFGVKISQDESLIVLGDAVISCMSFQDIFFRNKKDTLATQRVDACKYFIDRRSVVSDFVMDDDKLSKILELIHSDPIYYTMILTRNKYGKCPLEEAIENNSPKIVELFLSSLSEIQDFKLSRAIYHRFEELFEMGIDAFRSFLKVCYFQTEQMKMFKKMDTKGKDGVMLYHSDSSLMNDTFNQIFLTKRQIEVEEEEEDSGSKSEIQDQSDDFRDDETLISDISIPDMNAKSADKSKSNNAVEKRVEVKAIEFDWLLTTKDGERFLEHLSNTDVLSYFEIDVIKNIIMYQWSYFLPRIIISLFLPFLTFFILFLVYATWVLEKKNEENDSNGVWATIDLSSASAVLLFQLFFIYIEIHQLIFHK